MALVTRPRNLGDYAVSHLLANTWVQAARRIFIKLCVFLTVRHDPGVVSLSVEC